ncbi:MAG: HD domain-containing protein [Actinomycetota bacterium]|nr:HD domain-containing protein [Actinomycetota bacterium]
MLDMIEGYSSHHSHKLGILSVHLGKKLGLDSKYLRDIFYAALLHDIGEIAIADNILYNSKVLSKMQLINVWEHPVWGAEIAKKLPSLIYHKRSLTQRQILDIWEHTIIGEEIARQVPSLDGAAFLIRWSHEWWDGSGYPDQLVWDQIPLGSQIINICDTYDALLNDRPYRKAFSNEDTLKEIKTFSGVQFNPELAEEFLSLQPGFEKLLSRLEREFNALLGEFLPTEKELASFSEDYIMVTLRVFARVIDARHAYTQTHSWRVANIGQEIGEAMKLPSKEIEEIRVAALLHDVGKVAISGLILDKPYYLSKKEFKLIHAHPLRSEEVIRRIPGLEKVAEIVAYHHERYDGLGYPRGLSGSDIPLASIILAVADAFDAMTSDRPYRKALTWEQALGEVERHAGDQFDPEVVKVVE